MTLFSYEIFDAVARQGSFNKAAQQLHLTPSAISHAIAALFDLVPVAVEDAIAEINTGKPGTLDHQHLISPNAEATVGQIADECRRRLDVLSDAVKHHEVIAGTLHFRKFQRSHFRYSFQSFLIE